MLKRINNIGGSKGEAIKTEELRQLLKDLELKLKDNGLLTAAKVEACRFEGLVSDEIKKISGGLRKGLLVKSPLKKHRKKSLEVLLSDLKPYSGERRCRPYELLLFAAQSNLLANKLVRSGSSLEATLIPYPAYRLSVSILEGHRGTDITMRLDESE